MSHNTSSSQLGHLPLTTAAAFAFAAASLTCFAVVSPDLSTELRLSYSEVGAIAAAYLFTSGICQIPASLVGARLGNRRALLLALAVMSGCLFAGAWGLTFGGWLVARAVAGATSAAVFPLSVDLLTRTLNGRRRLVGLAVFVSGWGVGTTLMLLAGGAILHVLGWRQVILCLAGVGLLVMIFLWRVLGSSTDTPRVANASPRSDWRHLIGLMRDRRLNLMGLINAAGTSVLVSLAGWLPLYLTRTFGLSAADVSASLAALGLAMVAGGWSGGLLAARLGWRWVVTASLLGAAVLTALMPLLTSPFQIVAVAVVATLLAILYSAPIQAQLSEVAPLGPTALAAAYFNTLGWIGAFAASAVFGVVVDRTASFNAGWLWLALVPLAGVAAALSLPSLGLAQPLRCDNRQAADFRAE